MHRPCCRPARGLRPYALALLLSTLGLGAETALALPSEIPLSSDRQIALGVRLAPVLAAGPRSLVLPAQAMVPAQDQWVASSAASAFVQTVLVDNGSTVHQGQPVLRLQGSDIAMLQRAAGDAQGRAELAQSQLRRDELLFKEGIIPLSRLQQSRLAASEANRALAEQRLALQSAGATGGVRGEAILRAGRAGRITDLNVVPGQRVDPGQILLRVVDTGALYLEMAVPANQGREIPVGARVEVPDTQTVGTIQSKSPSLGAGQELRLRVKVERRGSLEGGQTVSAKVLLPTPPGSWRIPASAITRMDQRSVVFVRKANAFRVVPVQVLGRSNGEAVVTGGLHAGEQVAAAGVIAIQTAAGEVAP
ncbi:MAG: efflux RND transporter periplasmic adaptor subunit [Acidithiobacillus sp.]|uniref:efflux RND transporter periplasmic adaptor subunit n=1 Tax=Acidithiobacillus sp. TaxID=1872118 RepID=UPI003CFCB59E